MRILVTGSAGFIAGYLVEELLAAGHEVGRPRQLLQVRPRRAQLQRHPRYRFVAGRRQGRRPARASCSTDCDQFVAGAAIIGGISCSTSRLRPAGGERADHRRRLRRRDRGPPGRRAEEDHRALLVDGLRERHRLSHPRGARAPVPAAVEDLRLPEAGERVLRAGRLAAVGLPYTIFRPFNCVGIGERRALGDKRGPTGNIRLAMSHVVPDLVQKVLKGQDPLHILGDGPQVRTTPTAATWRAASRRDARTPRRPTRTSTSRRRWRPPCSSSPS